MSDAFAPFVAALGRGPGRSRDLSRAEARDAFAMILNGSADPMQTGAFLMLLRYRGENAATVAGLVEAARADAGLPWDVPVDLDWPSYGSGRTRQAPWFLLAALALAHSGARILMHGCNEFGAGQSVPEALEELGLPQAASAAAAEAQLAARNFAYVPLAALAPRLGGLLDLRAKFGLRSPVNTLVRLLNPAGAPVSVDGVFHPPYIETHLGAAEALGQQRLIVIKGGGGEAERNPFKPMIAYRWQLGAGRAEHDLAALGAKPAAESATIAEVWSGADAPGAVATIVATIALALLALRKAENPAEADAMALEVWAGRK